MDGLGQKVVWKLMGWGEGRVGWEGLRLDAGCSWRVREASLRTSPGEGEQDSLEEGSRSDRSSETGV